MRIALIGSHCVGKSTLMDPLCDRLDIHRIDEIVREWCKDNGYASVADVPNKNLMQWTILIEQVVREKMLTEHFGSYISDRSTVDLLPGDPRQVLGAGLPTNRQGTYPDLRRPIPDPGL